MQVVDADVLRMTRRKVVHNTIKPVERRILDHSPLASTGKRQKVCRRRADKIGFLMASQVVG